MARDCGFSPVATMKAAGAATAKAAATVRAVRRVRIRGRPGGGRRAVRTGRLACHQRSVAPGLDVAALGRLAGRLGIDIGDRARRGGQGRRGLALAGEQAGMEAGITGAHPVRPPCEEWALEKRRPNGATVRRRSGLPGGGP